LNILNEFPSQASFARNKPSTPKAYLIKTVASSIYNFVRSSGNRKRLKTLLESTFPKAHFGKGSLWKALFLAMSDANHIPL